jgi:hypothetical protein
MRRACQNDIYMKLRLTKNSGKNFEDRATRNAIVLTDEAVWAENMANLFLMETRQGNFDDMQAVLKTAHETVNSKRPAPVLAERQISGIRAYLRELLQQWQSLPAGQTMQLDFIF